LHGGPTSAISKVADNATAYAHRNALLKYEFYDRDYSGSYPANGFSFLNGWVSSITNASKSPTLYAAYQLPTLVSWGWLFSLVELSCADVCPK